MFSIADFDESSYEIGQYPIFMEEVIVISSNNEGMVRSPLYPLLRTTRSNYLIILMFKNNKVSLITLCCCHHIRVF